MSVIWKPMTRSILYTWNNLLPEANVLIDLKQESWTQRAERTNLAVGPSNANGLNYTKKRQSLHPVKNLRGVTFDFVMAL